MGRYFLPGCDVAFGPSRIRLAWTAITRLDSSDLVKILEELEVERPLATSASVWTMPISYVAILSDSCGHVSLATPCT